MTNDKFMKREIKRQKKIEREFHKRRFQETEKSIAETDGMRLSISSVVLDLLEELGFERKAPGTEYLSDVIETLYHERKVFDGENKFFDFNDRSNNHYIFSNDFYECGLKYLQKCIDEEVEKSYVSELTLNDIIYSVVNDVISQYDRCGRKLVLTQEGE